MWQLYSIYLYLHKSNSKYTSKQGSYIISYFEFDHFHRGSIGSSLQQHTSKTTWKDKNVCCFFEVKIRFWIDLFSYVKENRCHQSVRVTSHRNLLSIVPWVLERTLERFLECFNRKILFILKQKVAKNIRHQGYHSKKKYSWKVSEKKSSFFSCYISLYNRGSNWELVQPR